MEHKRRVNDGKTYALRKQEMQFIVQFPKAGLDPATTDEMRKLKELNLMYLDAAADPPLAHISHIGLVVRDLITKLWGAQKDRHRLRGEIAIKTIEGYARDGDIGKLRKELAEVQAELAKKTAEFDQNATIFAHLKDAHIAEAVARAAKAHKKEKP